MEILHVPESLIFDFDLINDTFPLQKRIGTNMKYSVEFKNVNDWIENGKKTGAVFIYLYALLITKL